MMSAVSGSFARRRAERLFAIIQFLHKLSEVVPKELSPILLDASVRAAPPRAPSADGLDVAQVRVAIRERNKIELGYVDDRGKLTQRTIWLKRATAYEQVAERIRAAILDKSLSADALLPPERELAVQFGVSRTTVREALRHLQAQGQAGHRWEFEL